MKIRSTQKANAQWQTAFVVAYFLSITMSSFHQSPNFSNAMSPRHHLTSPRHLTMATPTGTHWNTLPPTPSSTIASLPMTEADLLSQDPYSAYVGLLANDVNQANQFMEVASTGQSAGNAALAKLSEGLVNAKALCKQRRNESNAIIHRLQQEIAAIDSIETKTIPEAESLLSKALIFGTGERPKKLTADYFTKLFARSDIHAAGHDVAFLARKMFLGCWDDIILLDEDECIAVFTVLSNNYFVKNDGYIKNIQH
jgi:hypothetical protein